MYYEYNGIRNYKSMKIEFVKGDCEGDLMAIFRTEIGLEFI